MSIASEITRLQGAKADLKTAIESKGVTVPSATKLDGYADLVDAITQGGGATLITKSISTNGTYNASSDSADGYSQVNVSVPASAVDSGTKSITANGNNQDVVGYAAVNVNVPNTYSAGDEGKVVDNGALVAQTSDTVTENDTYDTTLISSLTVNVSGGGGSAIASGTFTPASESGSVTIDTGLSTLNGFLIIPYSSPDTGTSTLKLYAIWADVNSTYAKMMAVRGKGTSNRGFDSWISSTPPYTFSNGVISMEFAYPQNTGYFATVPYKWYAW